MEGFMTLSATCRRSCGSSAWKTMPMPPLPSTRRTTYGPSRPSSPVSCGAARNSNDSGGDSVGVLAAPAASAQSVRQIGTGEREAVPAKALDQAIDRVVFRSTGRRGPHRLHQRVVRVECFQRRQAVRAVD